MSAFITQTKMIRSASAAAIIVLGLRTLGGAATVALMVFRLSRNSPQCLHFLADAIEFRIIYLQRKEVGLLPEGHDQGWSAAHAAQRAAGMEAYLGEAGGTEVG